jgi:hypothetical protein
MSANIFSTIFKGLNWLRKRNFMKDSLTVGLFSGTIGAITIELFNVLLGKSLFFGKIASSMVVNPLRSNRLKNILWGEIMHLTIGAGIGSIIAQFFKKTGKDRIIIKGLFVSLLAWIGLHNLGNRMDLFSIKPRSTKDHYFGLLQHLLYGVTTSVVIKHTADPVIFRKSSDLHSINLPIERNLQHAQQCIPSEFESKEVSSQVGQ